MDTRKLVFMILITLMFGGHERCFSQLPVARHESVKEIIHKYYRRGNFNGSVVIADNDGVIYEDVLGYRDMEKQKKLKKETLIGLASVSKIFTSTAIMQLIERGDMDIDDSISKYLKELPDFYDKVRIRHLLTHTSGIPDCLTSPVFEVKNEDIYSFVKRQNELEFVPGTKYKYCNTAFVLLAMIIEKTSGMSYSGFLEENIFSVCGMENTVVGRDLSDSRFARSYHISGKEDDRANYYYGPGEIYSTAKDIYRFDRAYFSGKIVESCLIKTILNQNTLADGSITNYGLGWGVYKHGDEYLYGHTGGNYGFRTLYEHQSSSGLIIIILNNIGDKTPVMDIRTEIVNTLIN